MAVSTLIASMWSALGYIARSTTTHPAFAQARLRSDDWILTRAPSLAAGRDRNRGYRRMRRASTRLTSGWRYVGQPMKPEAARRLLGV